MIGLALYLVMMFGLILKGLPEKHFQESDTIFLKKGSVIGVHFIVPLEGSDKSKGEAFLRNKYFPGWRDLFPGSRVYYLKGEKGIEKDKNTFLWVFKDVNELSRYFPRPDSSTELYNTLRHKIDWLYADSTFNYYFGGYDESQASDYVVIDAGKPVNNDWLKPGALLGFHFIVIKPSVDHRDFEQFIHNIWAPNRCDAVPGSKVFFLKGIRGIHKDQYVFLWVLNSIVTRNSYFPSTDHPSKEYLQLQDQWKWLYGKDYRGRYFKGWDTSQASDFIMIQ